MYRSADYWEVFVEQINASLKCLVIDLWWRHAPKAAMAQSQRACMTQLMTRFWMLCSRRPLHLATGSLASAAGHATRNASHVSVFPPLITFVSQLSEFYAIHHNLISLVAFMFMNIIFFALLGFIYFNQNPPELTTMISCLEISLKCY
jgi:hypothetical protein